MNFHQIPLKLEYPLAKARLKVTSAESGQVYLYANDNEEHLFYRIDLKRQNVSSRVITEAIVTYHLRGAVVDIFSCHHRDAVLSSNGNIYLIPSPNKEKDLYSLRTIDILEQHAILKEKNCKAACSLGSEALAILLCNNFGDWIVEVYLLKSSFQGISLTRVFTTNEIFVATQGPVIHSIITAFRSNCGTPDSLPLNLMKSLVHDANEKSLNNWLILICIGEGNLFSVSLAINNDKTSDVFANITPLFNFHQNILSISKISFKDDKLKEGLSFVGALGKVLIISSCNAKTTTLELYIPGPIMCWVQDESTSIHSSDCASWLNRLELKWDANDAPNVQANPKQLFSDAIVSVELCSIEGMEKNVILITEDSQILVFKLSDFIDQNVNCLKQVPRNKFEILNAIVKSAHKMADIHQQQICQKKFLAEISCASHLYFNKSTRQTITCSLSTRWSPDFPHKIDFSISAKNTGQFSVIGQQWRFIAKISSLEIYRISSVPLSNGIEIGKSVDVLMHMDFPDIINQNIFPINISCGLQFCLKSRDKAHENNVNSVPFSFMIELSEWQINEFYYLTPSTTSEQPKIKQNFNNILWELANQRMQTNLHELSHLKQGAHFDKSTKPFEFSISFANNYIQNILNVDDSEKLMQAISIHLFKNSRNIQVLNAGQESSANLFGINFTLALAKHRDDTSKITITSHSPELLIKLKRSIIRRLKLDGDCGSNIDNTSLINLSDFIKSKLQEFEAMTRGCDNKNIKHNLEFIDCLYRNLRKDISVEFPSI